jgi:hypothetical protein
MVLADNLLTFTSRTEKHHAAVGHARNANLFPAVAA